MNISTTTGPGPGGDKTQNIQHQVLIQNPSGPIHLGPVYNLSVGKPQQLVKSENHKPDYDERNTCFHEHNQRNTKNENDERNTKLEDDDKPPREVMRPLWYSRRVIEREELSIIARNIGGNWKAVGKSLEYNSAKLDQFEADTKTMVDAVQRMLFRWINWKDQKATIGKLTQVLFENEEYDAIRVMKP